MINVTMSLHAWDMLSQHVFAVPYMLRNCKVMRVFLLRGFVIFKKNQLMIFFNLVSANSEETQEKFTKVYSKEAGERICVKFCMKKSLSSNCG